MYMAIFSASRVSAAVGSVLALFFFFFSPDEEAGGGGFTGGGASALGAAAALLMLLWLYRAVCCCAKILANGTSSSSSLLSSGITAVRSLRAVARVDAERSLARRHVKSSQTSDFIRVVVYEEHEKSGAIPLRLVGIPSFGGSPFSTPEHRLDKRGE
jgi:hypothetical protein